MQFICSYRRTSVFRRLRTYLTEKLQLSAEETTIENSGTFSLVLDITSDVIRLTD